MIDRELLAQVMKSHIEQKHVDVDASATLADDEAVRKLGETYARLLVATNDYLWCFMSAVAIGFNLGREYESLAGRDYRSKLTEPFGGL